jgi:hypothetical protein
MPEAALPDSYGAIYAVDLPAEPLLIGGVAEQRSGSLVPTNSEVGQPFRVLLLSN